ncbi:DUF3224 domain-containing protein [Rugosimonospora africana]|uniref:DUF3224 domain-containing protein n=1 Tax=Rugosimonospora africana TaxID=556532 RepID=A0A8J3QVR8_9ACTN|nr:DUF3224 domain-containing protein [Rugosimonospora africana]GIH17989.1 hypothetical protein Raf01_61610 [Rugosimonospora africana]
MSLKPNGPGRDHVTSESDVAVLKYDQAVISPPDDSGITLVETTLQERFSGGLDGDAIAKHLRVMNEDGTGTFTCVERFSGSLDGRPGSFALVAEGFTDEASVVHGRWEVVPGSGTGELAGLRGFAAFYAKQTADSRTGWAARDVLTYWFE